MIGITEIEVLLNTRDKLGLKETLSGYTPEEIADLLNHLEEEDLLLVFKAIDRETAFAAYELLDINFQIALLDLLPNKLVTLIINDMSPDKRTALFQELDNDMLNKHLKLLTLNERTVALNLLGYPENSIGRLMTPDYIAVRQDWTVSNVLNYIRKYGEDSETLDVIYIIDDRGKLIDDIKVREILLAETNTRIDEIINGRFTSLSVLDDAEVAVNVFSKNNRVALPVIDQNGLLLGIVTMDDVLRLSKQEDTEDIQKLGGVEALEDPYMEVPVPLMVKKRAVWLVVLFLGEMLTASAMTFFEDEIAQAVVLALFVPLIVSSGGNSGSQAATLIIRAMALGEITIRDWWLVLKREIISGFALGVILAIMGFLRIALWNYFTHIYGEHWLGIAFTVSFSLVGIVMWGTLMGSMLPIILKRVGIDPATSSAPFVATLVDVTGLIIYFSFALFFLKGTLL
ncbi:MAG: magnesium transporter [Bacteroidia bacterium]|nr:magnesium transporter [Bacteroidia bacterium]MCZ2247604.1 magnesium transporter [Bacteroidia bacterium]